MRPNWSEDYLFDKFSCRCEGNDEPAVFSFDEDSEIFYTNPLEETPYINFDWLSFDDDWDYDESEYTRLSFSATCLMKTKTKVYYKTLTVDVLECPDEFCTSCDDYDSWNEERLCFECVEGYDLNDDFSGCNYCGDGIV